MTEISNLPAVTLPFSGTELFPVTQNQVTKKSLLQNLTDYFGTPGILPYLPLAGGTMLGPLILARDPLGVMEAVTKRYVDTRLFPEAPDNLRTYGRLGPPSNSWNPVLPLTGGTLTGGLSVPDLGVTNNASISGSLGVVGGINVNGGLNVGQNLGVGGNISANGNISTPSGVYASYVESSGNIKAFNNILSDSLNTVHDAGIGGNLYVGGAANIANGLTTNNIHATNGITADGSISTTALFTTNLTAYGTLSTANLTTTNLSASGNLAVSGQISSDTVVTNGVLSYGRVDAVGVIGAGTLVTSGNLTASGGVYTNYVHSNGNIDAGGTFNGGALNISGIGAFGNYITCNSVFAASTLNSAGNVNTVTYQIQGSAFAFSGSNEAGSFTAICDSTGYPALDLYGANGTYYRTDNAHFFTNRSASFNICRFQSSDGNCINGSGLWNSVSDSSTKENVSPYTTGLAALLQLNPVSFNYITGSTRYAIEGQKYYGLIAQDVEPIVPEMVSSTTENGTSVATVASGHLVFLLLNAIKEIAQRLTALEEAAPAPAP